MKKMDLHIHIGDLKICKADLAANMDKCGVDGGILLSYYTKYLVQLNGHVETNEKRLANVMEWVNCSEKELYPFYFINPCEKDALDQVECAIELGISGFKIICHDHYPYDKRAIPVYQSIANHQKPILFHSGILYDGKNASGNNNRPCSFEVLLSIDNLRFALAHISWPWTDECVAVYGKFNDTLKKYRKMGEDYNTEMFIDMTPGTPGIFRKNAIEKLLFSGYDIENNLLFGSDNCTEKYDADYVDTIVNRDNGIYDELNVGQEVRNKIYHKNFYRFLGIESK